VIGKFMHINMATIEEALAEIQKRADFLGDVQTSSSDKSIEMYYEI